MKKESSNPVYPHFKHLLSQTGRYPARHIDIFWNLTDEWAIKDVEVSWSHEKHSLTRNFGINTSVIVASGSRISGIAQSNG
jgi:hypothetical protein